MNKFLLESAHYAALPISAQRKNYEVVLILKRDEAAKAGT
jgi:hypothetical protein